MLQAIRERAQGWIAWAIVILISIPFALWGIQEYLGVGAQRIAAKVEGQEITERELDQRFQQFRTELRQRLGKAYRPEMFDDTRMRAEVLNDMIRNRVILVASNDMGLRAGDAQVRATILSMPAFLKNGRFDKEAYERAVGYQGMSTAQFEQNVRASLMTTQLAQVVTGSEFVTERELAEVVRLRYQKRSFAYLTLPSKDYQTQDPVSDEAIQAYYTQEQDAFRTPEQVKLNYLVIDQKSASGTGGEADDDALKALYEERLESFRVPEERRARHILVTLDPGADDAAVKAARDKIEAIKARIDAGEDFATVAEETSQDPGSAAQGGDLGFFGKGLMDPAFEKAAFALPKGEVSGPVRSSFGYHLIQVTDVKPGRIKTFDEVKGQLAAELHRDDAQQKYFELAESLGNLTYEHPDSLVPAADALGLKVQQSDWIDRDGGEGILADARVLKAAFSDDVLNQGNNSELIEIDSPGGQKAVVVRVSEHQEASVRGLDEVRDRIVTILRDRRAQKAAEEEAAALAKRVREGETLEQVAGERSVNRSELVDRNATELSVDVLSEAFNLPAPTGDTPSVGVVGLRGGGAAVVRLEKVEDGSLGNMDEQQKADEGDALVRSLARTYYDRLVDDLRRRADVEILVSTSGDGAE